MNTSDDVEHLRRAICREETVEPIGLAKGEEVLEEQARYVKFVSEITMSINQIHIGDIQAHDSGEVGHAPCEHAHSPAGTLSQCVTEAKETGSAKDENREGKKESELRLVNILVLSGHVFCNHVRGITSSGIGQKHAKEGANVKQTEGLCIEVVGGSTEENGKNNRDTNSPDHHGALHQIQINGGGIYHKRHGADEEFPECDRAVSSRIGAEFFFESAFPVLGMAG